MVVYRARRFPISEIPERLNVIASKCAPSVMVKDTESFGLCLFATRDICVGEVITSETASLIIRNSNYVQGIMDLLVANSLEDMNVLDFFCSFSPLEATNVPSISESIKSTLSKIRSIQHESIDETFVTEFVSVFKLNGHSINSGKDAGIFPLASKAVHSCSPNVVTRCSGMNQLQIIAIKPIGKGALIENAYINGPNLAWPRHLRQRKILNDRGFICRCSRCSGNEDVRCFRCQNDDCGGDIYQSSYTEDLWNCSTCNLSYLPSNLPLNAENELEDALFIVLTDFATPQNISSLLLEAKKDLGDNHWIVFYLESFYLELALENSNIVIDESMRMHVAEWLETHMSKIHPVSCSMMWKRIIQREINNK